MPPKRTARLPKTSLFPIKPTPKPPSQARGPIFHSSTTSLEPLHQIVGIAKHQPQPMDITSVISHLPNQYLEIYNSMRSPSDQLPPTEVQLLFLQNFYVDERHALGFYVSCTDEQFEDGIDAGEMFFTACTDADLVSEGICFEGDAETRGIERSLGMKLWEGTWFRRGDRGKKEDLKSRALYFDRWKVAEDMWETRVKNSMISRKSQVFAA